MYHFHSIIDILLTLQYHMLIALPFHPHLCLTLTHFAAELKTIYGINGGIIQLIIIVLLVQRKVNEHQQCSVDKTAYMSIA